MIGISRFPIRPEVDLKSINSASPVAREARPDGAAAATATISIINRSDINIAPAATPTIPIVFAYGGDPVSDGLVASLNRPGGNVTGATFIGTELTSKRMGLLRDILPHVSDVALLVNPKGTLAEGQIGEAKAAAQALGLALHIVNATSESEFDEAFATMSRLKVGAFFPSTDPLFGLSGRGLHGTLHRSIQLSHGHPNGRSRRASMSYFMAKEIRPITTINAAAEPTLPSARAEAFYAHALRELAELDLPFLLAGTYALSAYTGVARATKDLDIVCKPSDYPRVLNHFRNLGYTVEIEDERWLGKVFQDEHFFDVIFAFWHGMAPVTDQWFESAPRIEMFGTPMRVITPTELIWSKAFVQLRRRYDGADIAHLILKQHDQIDWRRLLAHMELHWEVLLAHLLNFRWAYPSERDFVPRWLMDELVARLKTQFELPPPRVKICRGRLFSQVDYEPAVEEWGFVDADEDSV